MRHSSHDSSSKPEPTGVDTGSDPASIEETRRILELELLKVRSEASAARLEAQAAEIELMMRRLASERDQADQISRKDPPSSGLLRMHVEPDHEPALPETRKQFASWDEVRTVRLRSLGSTESPPSGIGTGTIDTIDSPTTGKDDPGVVCNPPASSDTPVVRFDEAHSQTKRPRIFDLESDPVENADDELTSSEAEPTPDDAEQGVQTQLEAASLPSTEDMNFEEEDALAPRRRRPAAWLLSVLVHVGILVLLAAIGLQTHRPKDQVALTASATSENEMSMQTFEIESSEPEADPEVTETPMETQFEISPVGELAAVEFKPEAMQSPASQAVASMASSASKAVSAMSIKSNSSEKIQFCGVEGGGNHFIYLVDSSNSMGDAFDSARRELLASIEMLKPQQRFYVVFFDADPDYMRLENPNQNDSLSAKATNENKAALRRWAMRVSKDRGRNPKEPLEFALKLRGDVIFLLSDGEFPQSIEDLLKEQNKIENLFGESRKISIVHTINYHSKEGESRMRRIAEQNGGQYRHVPKP